MNKRRESIKYIIFDYLAGSVAWTLFYLYRKIIIEPQKFGYDVQILDSDSHYYIGIVVIPVFWIFLFWMFGTYRNIYRKSRVKEFGQTFTITFIGSILLFFILLLDDEVKSYTDYRYTFFTLLSLQFGLTYLLRLVILTNIKQKLKKRIIGFNTILIGSNQRALKLYSELENEKYSQGYKFLGFVSINGGDAEPVLQELIPKLGSYKDINAIVKKHNAEEVILAVETSEHPIITQVLNFLEGTKTIVKVIPDVYDYITGSVKMNYIFGTALIEINRDIMPVWQKNVKRFIDVAFSLFILLVGFPIYVFLAIGVKLSSSGPVFYNQERIGKNGVKFVIHKFRTMHQNAEKAGPQLSSKEDPRITKFGRFLRKYRLDEFPQFWNVVKGDMSLVGPRPERQHFIDLITKEAPHYAHLLKVKPGITSWGQIKFGYAETVAQMVERMKFDLLYVENMSLAMDVKILFYTILIMIQGRGK